MTALQIYLVGQIGYISLACFFLSVISVITIVLASSIAMQKKPTKATNMVSFAMAMVSALCFATAVMLPNPHSLNQIFADANNGTPLPAKGTTNGKVNK